MKTNVIVDGMNIAFRCSYIYDKKQGLQNSEGLPTGTIYGFARHMVKLRDRFPGADIWVAWEGAGSREERRAIYADYKGNRKDETSEGPSETRQLVFDQVSVLQDLLEATGIHQVSAAGYEADDMIATLVRDRFSDDEYKNVIISSDRDLLQLVGDGTVQMTPHPEKFFDALKVEEEYGVPPRLLLSYRVFDGDKSDNMPGMYRFPRKKIATIVQEHDGDLESIYNDCEVKLTEFQENTLTDFEDQAYVNRDIMYLRSIEDYDEREGRHDEEVIERFCDQLDIESIRADLLSFTAKTGFVKTGDTNVSTLHPTAGSAGTGE
jgi:DNA polymerase-1